MPDTERDAGAPDAAKALDETLFDTSRGAVRDDSARPPALTTDFAARYLVSDLLGRGGMGEVRRCRDHTIGRDVAMKVIRRRGDELDAAMLARFVREARVQGQLEHPAIVPVYDLGVDPDGSMYFTMKRVRGMSLEAIVRGLREGDPAVVGQYSRRRLLTAFSSVCLAVHFAHARGVLHRDLKPANVMLGDFGEVYVLDWGLAKIVDAAEPAAPAPVELASAELAMTEPGSILGTPGYMSPEQIRGPFDAVDATSDVYSLGAMLFEVLALEPLHPQASVPERVASTLVGADARPSARRPDLEVPPELDALCVRATATERDARARSARELSEAIEAYLDGDRNLELRRAAASPHAERAEQALALAREGGSDEHVERSRAMREATSALGLDPGNTAALRTLVALLAEPPRTIPPEAKAELDASSQEIERTVVSWGFPAYLPYALLVPFLVWMGVRDWGALALNAVFLSVAAVCCLIAGRMRVVPEFARAVIVAFSCLGIFWSSLAFGPFVLTPMFALSHTIALLFSTGGRLRMLTVLVGCVATVAPYVAQRLGWWPTSYVLHDGVLTIVPNVVSFSPTATMAYLLFANLLVIVLGGVLAGRFRDLLAESEMRRQLQAWQLRQAVPEQARVPTR